MFGGQRALPTPRVRGHDSEAAGHSDQWEVNYGRAHEKAVFLLVDLCSTVFVFFPAF